MDVMRKLWDLKLRQKAKIIEFSKSLPKNYVTRLEELGLTEGTEVECCKTSPFRGPKSFVFGDCIFSIDRDIASHVQVEFLKG